MIFFADAGVDEWPAVEKLYFQILDATFTACKKAGGVISHHHGIGMAKKEWMELEHGKVGMGLLSSLKTALDPQGIMNPGKLGLGE